ncbi:hypothetical protein BH23BAC3_BH23BAC3_30340 [soil metagenome]
METLSRAADRRPPAQAAPARSVGSTHASTEKKHLMNANTFHHKQYSSASQRLLKPQIERFFAEQFPKLFGPVIRAHLAEALLELFTRQVRETTTLNRIKSCGMRWTLPHAQTLPTVGLCPLYSPWSMSKMFRTESKGYPLWKSRLSQPPVF